MKELSIKEKAKAYDEAVKEASIAYKDEDRHLKAALERIFPELKESEDEKIRKYLIERIISAYGENSSTPEGIKVKNIINWLEKRKRLYSDYEESELRRGLLWHLKELQNIEKSKGLPIKAKATYESWITWLEKQGEQNPIINVPSREVILAIWDLGNEWKELTNGSISTEHGTQLDYIQKHWHESEYYLREKQGEQYPANKVEPKFKVKYAGSEYNVFETKNIAGVPFYGIEDEPNHIDYVQAGNCEIIDGGYGIKEGGFSIPTKPAMFSEQKSADKVEDEEYNGEDYGIDSLFHAQRILEKTLGKVDGYQTDDGILSHQCAISAVKKLYEHKFDWSEEDEIRIKNILSVLDVQVCWDGATGKKGNPYQKDIDWLKSLKPQNHWKPTEAQLTSLTIACDRNDRIGFDLTQLLKELKKL